MSEPRPEYTLIASGHEHIARVLTEAVNAARARGIPVLASSDRGVINISEHARERWAVRPPRTGWIYGVSPTGAVILDRQPVSTEAESAACEALGVEPPWLIGFEAGVGGELPHHNWDEHVAARLIGQGYAMGREVRTFIMTEECAVHSIRHRRGTCPLCVAEASGDNHSTPYVRDAGVIGPVPTRERR